MKRTMSIVKTFLLLAVVCTSIVSCKKSSTENSNATPSNGWKLGATTYTTAITFRNAGMLNTMVAFDAIPTPTNTVNRFSVIFNNTTGIAAGTYKLVTKPNQSDLLADEMMVSPGVGFSSSGSMGTEYVTVAGQTVSATVTITGGKATIVVPNHNVVSVPINASSTTTTFLGTFVEQ